MKWDEIQKTFENEWVLVKIGRVDENFHVLEGEVLAHSKDKDEVYKELLRIKPEEFSIECVNIKPRSEAPYF
jgi:hypothetical protein